MNASWRAPREWRFSSGAGVHPTPKRRCRAAFQKLIVALFCLSAAPLFAHEARPAYLELRELPSGEFSVLWKTPMRGEMRLALSPAFSGHTENVTPVATRESGGAAVQTWRIKTGEPLRGQSLRIQGLEATMTDALARIEFTDGTSWLRRLTPQEPAATISAQQTAWSVAGEYLKLGVEHILLGIDHLLFVLALLLITQGTWRLVKTITAFTVAHSITLALAALGFVHVPQAPVEAIIALSIVFVAAEILRMKTPSPLAGDDGMDAGGTTPRKEEVEPRLEQRPRATQGAVAEGWGERESLTYRAPWIVAFTFGLLHGFGFAGALAEIGLPEGHIPLALLFFNVGVELGQLLFIAAVLSAIATIRRIRLRFPRWTALVPPYAIGSVAMFWVIQRVAAF